MGKKPVIRFEGYTEDWEQRKVGDITTESSEYANLEVGYPLLTSSRAGLMYQNEYRGNLTTDSKEALFSVVPLGACTYRHMSDDNVFHLNVNTLEKGLVSREYPVFFASEGNRLDFVVKYINSSASFRAFCAEQKKGGTRTRLYYNTLCEFKMMVPSQWEQDVIADFFLKLDNLITLHQCNYEKMVATKKSMLDKLFPQGEEKVPAIRFEGFEGDWEKYKFSEVFDFLQNNTLSRAELSNSQSDVMNVHYGDILVRYGAILDIKKDKMTYLLNETLVEKYKASLLQNGDIIIADTAEDKTVGKCSEIVGLTDEQVLAGLHTIPCRPKRKFAEGFTGYYMSSNSYHNQLLPLIQGTKVSSVSKASIQDTYIVCPDSELEQKQIAGCLKSLDDLIELYRVRVEKLKNIKAACLQEMFV